MNHLYSAHLLAQGRQKGRKEGRKDPLLLLSKRKETIGEVLDGKGMESQRERERE